MLVLNLFLVYATVCMAVLKPGQCAQKNVLEGLSSRPETTAKYRQVMWKENSICCWRTVGFLISNKSSRYLNHYQCQFSEKLHSKSILLFVCAATANEKCMMMRSVTSTYFCGLDYVLTISTSAKLHEE